MGMGVGILPRKHDIRWSVGILMMNAKRSSMNVLSALYMKNFHGRHATDLSLQCMNVNEERASHTLPRVV